MVSIKKIKLYLLLIIYNLIIWLTALLIYHHYPLALSLCLLAYGFGLRHGLDADHIAAINSVTCKLLANSSKQNIQNGIGFFFSLGHSTVVIMLSAFVALTSTSIHAYFPKISTYGAIAGTFCSIFFLLLFAITNLVILAEIIKDISHKNKTTRLHNINPGGILSKILTPLLNTVTKIWHMYFVGFLFGLGFDTATEVALVGISAYSVTQHISIWGIMLFPALFTAGMCLVDTTSGMLIFRACNWAYIDATRKLYYNLVITLFSLLTAALIAGYEIVNIILSRLNLRINIIYNHFELIGAGMIAVFVITWLLASQLYKIQRAP